MHKALLTAVVGIAMSAGVALPKSVDVSRGKSVSIDLGYAFKGQSREIMRADYRVMHGSDYGTISIRQNRPALRK